MTAANGFERYLLLERSGNNKANTSVFEMRLNGKKVHIRHGNKGQKLAKKIFKKASISEAIALFSDKRKQKINDGYRIIKEEDKNNLNNINHNKSNNPLNDAIPLSGKSIQNPNHSQQNNSNNNKSFSFTFGQKQRQKNGQQQQQQKNPPQKQKLADLRQQLQKMSISNNSHSDDTDSTRSGRLKHGNQPHQDRPRKSNPPKIPKQRHKAANGKKKNKVKKGKGKQNHNKKKHKRNRNHSYNTESSVASSMVSYDDDQENNSQTANGNGYHSQIAEEDEYEEYDDHEEEEQEYDDEQDEEEFDSAMASTEEEEEEDDDEEESEEEYRSRNGYKGKHKKQAEVEEDDDEEEEDDDDAEEEEEEEEESGSDSDDNSSVQSGRSSDNEYEMDYEKMSHVMSDALHKKVDYKKLEWKPIKLWIRFNEYHDLKGEYALAPQTKRIAGSCHELLVIYMRSTSFKQEENKVYKRLLKLARDPEEDNKYHFETERKWSQYLYRMATMVNNTYSTRTDVSIWPVETIQFLYNGKLKWATIQPPFLPDKITNNIFVKIEPNSGKPCVDDPVVGRYQHLFSAITRGLDLVRDWQGYGVPQEVFLNVCEKFDVQKEALSQIKVRRNANLQRQTRVLVVIDPVLTTCHAHYETNNPTDFGVKAIDEWKSNHDCIRCRCKYYHLLSVNITDSNPDGMLFGIADPDQMFFNKDTIPQNVYREIQKCRYDLNIWCGDDFIDQFENDQDAEDDAKINDERVNDDNDDNEGNINNNKQNDIADTAK